MPAPVHTEGRVQQVVACRLGKVDYEAAWELQRRLQAVLVEAKRAEAEQTPPHVLLMVEHDPVYTLGKSGSEGNLVWDEAQRERAGVQFHRIDRGGDITFHGPGQLVAYPILDLDRFFTDIHRYLRELEEVVILTLDEAGLAAGRFPGRTGVWIGPDAQGAERKICAMGVRCSRWVTMHGLALNVSTDLDFYDGIVPCGIDDRGVTSMIRELGGASPSMDRVMDGLEARFGERFSCSLRSLSGDAARGFLAGYLGSALPAGL